jgi:hypothetical protein
MFVISDYVICTIYFSNEQIKNSLIVYIQTIRKPLLSYCSDALSHTGLPNTTHIVNILSFYIIPETY